MTIETGGGIKKSLRRPVQYLTSFVASLLGLLIRRPWTLSVATDALRKRGFHLLPQHYYVPIPDPLDCNENYQQTRSEMVGLHIDDRRALDLLDQVVVPYLSEFRTTFPTVEDPGKPGFFLLNGNYMAIDAHVYFSMIRHGKSRRVVEIGSGNSTLLAAAAVMANLREGHRSELIAIEPNPGPQLRGELDGLSRLIATRVQDVPLDFFESLTEGDILFIDSSHVLRSGGDVQYEYLEILPRLAPGVLVHVHDISLPKPYPRVYFDRQLYWNEQYVLQAFLVFNDRFEIIWPGNALMERHPDRLRDVFPEFDIMKDQYPDSEPSAFWMRVHS